LFKSCDDIIFLDLIRKSKLKNGLYFFFTKVLNYLSPFLFIRLGIVFVLWHPSIKLAQV